MKYRKLTRVGEDAKECLWRAIIYRLHDTYTLSHEVTLSDMQRHSIHMLR